MAHALRSSTFQTGVHHCRNGKRRIPGQWEQILPLLEGLTTLTNIETSDSSQLTSSTVRISTLAFRLGLKKDVIACNTTYKCHGVNMSKEGSRRLI